MWLDPPRSDMSGRLDVAAQSRSIFGTALWKGKTLRDTPQMADVDDVPTLRLANSVVLIETVGKPARYLETS